MTRGKLPLLLLLCALSAVAAEWAGARPGNGPRQTVDQTFTAKLPGAPTGLGFRSEYHAPGDRKGDPPYLRRMVIFPPRGLRYDTSVPVQCKATDAELQVQGPDACPPESLLGKGETEGIFLFPVAHQLEFHRFWHRMYVLNNAREQIFLVESEGFTVIRSKLRRDGAWVLNPPSCFPTPPGGCVDDYIIQLKSATKIPPVTRRVNGKLRSYATTPRRCPRSGFWRTRVRFFWGDGAVDNVTTKQPCRRRRA